MLAGLLLRHLGVAGLVMSEPNPLRRAALQHHVGCDAIDGWRVIAVDPGRRLTLLAEMKLPGSAALELEVLPEGPARTRVHVTGYFHPAGAPGLLDWYSLVPARSHSS